MQNKKGYATSVAYPFLFFSFNSDPLSADTNCQWLLLRCYRLPRINHTVHPC
jgi:hypothetical protein